MQIYRKEVSVPALNAKSASFTLSASPRGESVKSGVLYPVKSLNFRNAGESLRGGAGLRLVCGAEGFGGRVPEAVYFLRTGAEERLAFFSDGKLYACTLTAADGTLSAPVEISAGGIVFAAPPQAVYFVDAENAQKLFFCAPEGCFVWDGENFSSVTDAPSALCGCTYYERIFLLSAETGYRVHFSAPLAQTVFASAYRSAGYVDLAPEYGDVVALLPRGDEICALRERGLTVLHAERENVEFSAVSLPAPFGAVHRGSAQVAGENVVFLADDRLYVYDGSKMSRIAEEWLAAEPPAAAADCVSFARGGQYVLTYTTAAGARCTLFYDLAAKRGFLSDSVMTAPVYGAEKEFLPFAVGLCGFAAADEAELSVRKVWESEYTLLGLGAGRKLLKKLTLIGKGGIKLTVAGEHARNKRVYDITLDGQVSVFPQLRDTGFFVRIESDGGECVLSGLQAEGAALKGV